MEYVSLSKSPLALDDTKQITELLYTTNAVPFWNTTHNLAKILHVPGNIPAPSSIEGTLPTTPTTISSRKKTSFTPTHLTTTTSLHVTSALSCDTSRLTLYTQKVKAIIRTRRTSTSLGIYLCITVRETCIKTRSKSKNIQQLGFAGGHPPNY